MFQLKIKSLSPELLLTGVTLSACCPVLQSVADDCLSALEVEAADVSAASQPLAATVSSPLKKARPARAGKVIAGGLSFKKFEEALESSYAGSHFLYISLSESKRRSVCKFYQNANRTSSVAEEIVRLLSSGQ